MSGPGFETWRALGTTVVVGAADPQALTICAAVVREEIEACDLACSRFRDDSELAHLNAAGHLQGASEWLWMSLSVALDAAWRTDGIVDPTVGQSLIALGYDQSFDRLDVLRPVVATVRHVPAWRQVRMDPTTQSVRIPAGVTIDLGATAKALCADRAAGRAAAATGSGILVSLGGDIAVAGPAPAGGWRVRVTERSDSDPADDTIPGQTVAISGGGLATSGTSVRRWGGPSSDQAHHLIDPRSGRPAREEWRTVTVAASTCVAANTASTAAMILGVDAAAWLTDGGFDARLVTPHGEVVCIGSWPADPVPVP